MLHGRTVHQNIELCKNNAVKPSMIRSARLGMLSVVDM